MQLLLASLIVVAFLTQCLAFSSPSRWGLQRHQFARLPSLHSTPEVGDATPTLSESRMSIDEIKAELDLRGVDFEDCFSKSDLVLKLAGSRTMGKADPSLIDKYNTMQVDGDFNINDVDDALIDDVLDADGKLPGGMSKEMVKALTADPAIMSMMGDPKMQQIMKAVMSGGPDAFRQFATDPDAMVLLQRLAEVMGRVNGGM